MDSVVTSYKEDTMLVELVSIYPNRFTFIQRGINYFQRKGFLTILWTMAIMEREIQKLQ